MNRGIQKDLQGKRQAFARLDSSLSRSTTLCRQQEGGRGHFNQETGMEAAMLPVCLKGELSREGMRVTVGKANEDYRDLEDGTEAWDFIPAETEDFDGPITLSHFRNTNPAVGEDCSVTNGEPYGKGTKDGPQSDSSPPLLVVRAEVLQVSPQSNLTT